MTTSSEGGPSAVSIAAEDNQSQTQQATTTTENSSTDDGTKSEPVSFVSALSQENRDYFTKKGWKDDASAADNVLKSYRELEKLQGKNSQQTQQPEVQLPAKASDYQFKLPDGIPSEGFYDNKLADAFKEIAFKAKLPADIAQTVHDEFVKNQFSNFEKFSTDQATQLNTAIQTAHDDLVKDWKGADTPQFKRNVEMARRAMTHLDPNLKDALKAKGVLVDHKGADGKVAEVVADATIFKALAKAGTSLFAEDSMYGSRPVDQNPFDPKHHAAMPDFMKRQGDLIRQDRELAKTLIRAAGQEKHWPHMFTK